MILLFIICVALANGIISLTTDYDKYFYPAIGLIPKLKTNGIIFISLNLLIIFLAGGQYFYQDHLDTIKDNNNKIEKKISDSIAFSNYKKSLDTVEMKRENTDTVLMKMLVEQGIDKEAIQNELAKNKEEMSKGLKKISDSSHKDEIRPSVYLSIGKELVLDSVSNKVYNFTANTTSQNASSTGFNLVVSLLIFNSLQGYSYKGHFLFLSSLVTIPKDQGYETGFQFSNLVKPEILYFWLRGTFQNEDKTKTYPPINTLYVYDFTTKKVRSVFAQTEFDRLTGIISSHE